MKVHALVVTYRRPELLRATVSSVLGQSMVPDTWTVVDNAPGDDVREWALGLPKASYVAMPDNAGPAGGISAGMLDVLERAEDDDLLLLIDDDDPPPFPDCLQRLHEVLVRDLDCEVGGVGMVGARFDRRRGLVRRVLDDELIGDVDVDYIGGGQCPLYRVRAVRSVGTFDDRLFFGFEELEYGLRMRSGGYRLVIEHELWRRLRSHHEREGLGHRVAGTGLPPWRRYYSARNLVLVTRRYGGWRASVVCAARSGPGSALRAVLRGWHWREASMALRGSLAGLAGRSGRVHVPST